MNRTSKCNFIHCIQSVIFSVPKRHCDRRNAHHPFIMPTSLLKTCIHKDSTMLTRPLCNSFPCHLTLKRDRNRESREGRTSCLDTDAGLAPMSPLCVVSNFASVSTNRGEYPSQPRTTRKDRSINDCAR